jgi:dihydrofolate reductase
MTATYTWDVFQSLDGFASYGPAGDWGGYWGKHGPEFLDRRLAQYSDDLRLVLGATTFRQFLEMLDPKDLDAVNERLRNAPATVISSSLEGPFDWPNATVVGGDAADIVARLKSESDVPLRSHGSLELNRALMAASLVDLVQLTIFPVITGQTGTDPVFAGAADFDLELVDSHTLDGHTLELTYRPTLH